jgi:hypothetical protein
MTHPFDNMLRPGRRQETNLFLAHASMMQSVGSIARQLGPGSGRIRGRRVDLMFTAIAADDMLRILEVEDPGKLYKQEFEAAKRKHPGHTFDLPEVPDGDKYWALAEEVGEVAAALTYDNSDDTGHKAELIKEIVQVGALALAWMVAVDKEAEQHE